MVPKKLRQQLPQEVGQRGRGVEAVEATDVQVLAEQFLHETETLGTLEDWELAEVENLYLFYYHCVII